MSQLTFVILFTAAPFVLMVLPHCIYHYFRFKKESAETERKARLIYGDDWKRHVGIMWS